MRSKRLSWETARGRWFLAEYARRNRSADTDMLLSAIDKLDRNLSRKRDVPNIESIKLDIADMADAIDRTKREIAQITSEEHQGGPIFDASNELDAIVEHTESATQEILAMAETIQELAFTMREAGVDDEHCDKLEELTTNIYMSCSFQDLTGQRTQKVVHVLRYLESRVNAMIQIWHIDEDDIEKVKPDPIRPDDTRPDVHLLNGPQMDGQGTGQIDIDSIMAEEFDVTSEPPVEAHEEPDIEAENADSADVDLTEAETEAPEIIEYDLDFADSDLMADLESLADADLAIDVDAPDVADEMSKGSTAGNAMQFGDEEADIFEADPDGETVAIAETSIADDAETDEFAGADVFEAAEAKGDPDAEASILEASEAADDPLLDLSPGERMALFH